MSGRLGLKSLYAKTSMPPGLMPAFRVAVDVVHETVMDGGASSRWNPMLAWKRR